MMKVFAVFRSADMNRATAAGHHSPISAFTEGTMLGNRRRATTPESHDPRPDGNRERALQGDVV
jgi:hypothetical protein